MVKNLPKMLNEKMFLHPKRCQNGNQGKKNHHKNKTLAKKTENFLIFQGKPTTFLKIIFRLPWIFAKYSSKTLR